MYAVSDMLAKCIRKTSYCEIEILGWEEDRSVHESYGGFTVHDIERESDDALEQDVEISGFHRSRSEKVMWNLLQNRQHANQIYKRD